MVNKASSMKISRLDYLRGIEVNLHIAEYFVTEMIRRAHSLKV